MEYYRKCNVCGKINCYTDSDIKENSRQAVAAGMAALGSIASGIGGTRYDMYEMNKVSNKASNRVVDYSKCPNCGSKDTVLVTKKFAIFSNKMDNKYTSDDILKEANIYLNKKDYENAFCFSTMALIEDNNIREAYLIKFLSSYEVSNLKELDNKYIDYSNNQHFINLLEHSNNKEKEKLLKQCNNIKKNKIIKDANVLLESNNKPNVIKEINTILKEIETNNIDNNNIVKELIEKKNNIKYNKACSYLKEGTKDKIEKSKKIFEQLKDYKDSNNKIEECINELNIINKEDNKNTLFIVISITIIIVVIIVLACIGK